MLGADRWTAKILALPIFDDQFAQAVLETSMRDLAFVAAMEVSSGAEFSARVAEFATTFDEAVSKPLLDRVGMLEQFWSLASKAEKIFLESTSFQLGFGLCEGVVLDEGSSKLRKSAALKSLLGKPSAPGKRLKTSDAAGSSSTPLLDAESAEQMKWAARLEAIGRRAGQHAKLFDRDD